MLNKSFDIRNQVADYILGRNTYSPNFETYAKKTLDAVKLAAAKANDAAIKSVSHYRTALSDSEKVIDNIESSKNSKFTAQGVYAKALKALNQLENYDTRYDNVIKKIDETVKKIKDSKKNIKTTIVFLCAMNALALLSLDKIFPKKIDL